MKTLPRRVVVLATVYLAASLTHFVHNAEFMDEYPNLPAWLGRVNVYLAWAVTLIPCALGILAWVRVRYTLAFGLFAVWGALGLLGLDHYYVAPVAAHTATANFTIVFEALAGTALLFSSIHGLVRSHTGQHGPAA